MGVLCHLAYFNSDPWLCHEPKNRKTGSLDQAIAPNGLPAGPSKLEVVPDRHIFAQRQQEIWIQRHHVPLEYASRSVHISGCWLLEGSPTRPISDIEIYIYIYVICLSPKPLKNTGHAK